MVSNFYETAYYEAADRRCMKIPQGRTTKQYAVQPLILKTMPLADKYTSVLMLAIL